jgi:hypothetical protein
VRPTIHTLEVITAMVISRSATSSGTRRRFWSAYAYVVTTVQAAVTARTGQAAIGRS